MHTTLTVLMTAPLASRVQIELTIDLGVKRYSERCGKKLSPLVIIESMDVSWAMRMDFRFVFPRIRSF